MLDNANAPTLCQGWEKNPCEQPGRGPKSRGSKPKGFHNGVKVFGEEAELA